MNRAKHKWKRTAFGRGLDNPPMAREQVELVEKRDGCLRCCCVRLRVVEEMIKKKWTYKKKLRPLVVEGFSLDVCGEESVKKGLRT